MEVAQAELRASILAGEGAKKYGLTAEDVETQAKLLAEQSKNVAEGFELDIESATRMAVANQRLNRGIKTLHDNWEEWSDILNNTDHGMQDYAETLNDARDALADMVGAIDADAISLDFLDNTTDSGRHHLELMGLAAQGNVDAINQLGIAVGYAAIEMLEFSDNTTQVFDEVWSNWSMTAEEFTGYKDTVLQGIT